MAADGDIRIELDGPGVKPETVAARTLLDVASAFLDVVERLAAADAEEVTFRGLRVEAKCVAIVTNLEPARFARPLADQARALAETTAPPPRGLDTSVRRLREAIGRLPEGVGASVLVGPWKAPIATTTPQRASLPHELLELRAIPVRVGGARRSVRFDSESEADSFTLDATEDQCRRVGAHLYKELDITAGVRRGADGKIEGGKLDDFICVDARDGGASWREWFRESAEDWSRATDVVGELGRRD